MRNRSFTMPEAVTTAELDIEVHYLGLHRGIGLFRGI